MGARGWEGRNGGETGGNGDEESSGDGRRNGKSKGDGMGMGRGENRGRGEGGEWEESRGKGKGAMGMGVGNGAPGMGKGVDGGWKKGKRASGMGGMGVGERLGERGGVGKGRQGGAAPRGCWRGGPGAGLTMGPLWERGLHGSWTWGTQGGWGDPRGCDPRGVCWNHGAAGGGGGNLGCGDPSCGLWEPGSALPPDLGALGSGILQQRGGTGPRAP